MALFPRRPRRAPDTLIGLPVIDRHALSAPVPSATPLPSPAPSPMLSMPASARVGLRGRHRADGTGGLEGRDMRLATELTASLRRERAKREAVKYANVYPKRDVLRDTWEGTLVLHHRSARVRWWRRVVHRFHLAIIEVTAGCEYLVRQVQ